MANILTTVAESAAIAAMAETLKNRGMSDVEAYNTARQIVTGQAPQPIVVEQSFLGQYKWPLIIGVGVVVAYFLFFNKPSKVTND